MWLPGRLAKVNQISRAALLRVPTAGIQSKLIAGLANDPLAYSRRGDRNDRNRGDSDGPVQQHDQDSRRKKPIPANPAPTTRAIVRPTATYGSHSVPTNRRALPCCGRQSRNTNSVTANATIPRVRSSILTFLTSSRFILQTSQLPRRGPSGPAVPDRRLRANCRSGVYCRPSHAWIAAALPCASFLSAAGNAHASPALKITIV